MRQPGRRHRSWRGLLGGARGALAANSRVADHEVARAMEVAGAFNAGAAASAHGAFSKEA